MIIKGSSRKGPVRLARHLLRADTNERVHILELQSPHDELVEAFRDWQVLTDGTRGELGLYHAQINPDARYGMTPEQWERTIAVLEKELGFEGQPRAVVMHEKHGRAHLHVVWARTDIETMTLRSDGLNYAAHERASLQLEKEFGHEITPGKHAKRDREKQPDLPKSEITHGEWQQAERTGVDPRTRKEQLTALFSHCDNGQALKAGIEEQGYVLAQGDRRDFVLVDRVGEVHNLGRQIKGVKAAELREFMSDIDRNALPTVEEAKELQRQAKQSREDKEREEEGKNESPPDPAPPVEEKSAADNDDELTKREIRKLEKALTERHAREASDIRERQREEEKRLRTHFKDEIQEKLGHKRAMQQAERDRWQRQQRHGHRKGLWGFIDAIQSRINPQLQLEKTLARRKEFEDMKARQRQERADYLALIKQTRDLEIEALKERHEDQRRKHGDQYDKEFDRYLREHDAARQLVKEREEIAERQRQREAEEKRGLSGPDPPPPRRAR